MVKTKAIQTLAWPRTSPKIGTLLKSIMTEDQPPLLPLLELPEKLVPLVETPQKKGSKPCSDSSQYRKVHSAWVASAKLNGPKTIQENMLLG